MEYNFALLKNINQKGGNAGIKIAIIISFFAVIAGLSYYLYRLHKSSEEKSKENKPSGNPSGNPSGKPSGNPSGNPSEGDNSKDVCEINGTNSNLKSKDTLYYSNCKNGDKRYIYNSLDACNKQCGSGCNNELAFIKSDGTCNLKSGDNFSLGCTTNDGKTYAYQTKNDCDKQCGSQCNINNLFVPS